MTTEKKPVMIYLSDELVNYLSDLAIAKNKTNRDGTPRLATIVTDILTNQLKLNNPTEPEKTTDRETNEEIKNLKDEIATLKEAIKRLEVNFQYAIIEISTSNERISDLEKMVTQPIAQNGSPEKLKEPETKKPDPPKDELGTTNPPEIIKDLPVTKDYETAVQKIKELNNGGMKPGTIAELLKRSRYLNKNGTTHWTYQTITQILK